MRVAAVILAAGASSRMGVNKMLLHVDGVPMVRRAVLRATAAGLAPVIVVVGRDEDDVRAALGDVVCTVVRNPDFTGPTSGSLHIALRAMPEDVEATMILLADMVHVTTDMMQAIVQAAQAHDAPLSVSEYGDVLAPPLLFRRALWPELLAWHGEGCGKAVVKAHRAEAVMHAWPPDALRDVDTPEDYHALTAAAAAVSAAPRELD